MRNELTITITGHRAGGKTAIAQLIYEALVAHQVMVDEAPTDVVNGRDPYRLGVAIGTLMAGGLGVRIVEQTLAKSEGA